MNELDWSFFKGEKYTNRGNITRVAKGYIEYLGILKKKGWTLNGDYFNNQTKVELVCDKGHEFQQKPHGTKSGDGCLACSGRCPKQAKKDYLELLTKRGWVLRTEYVNNSKKVGLTCEKGHDFEQRPYHTKGGDGCPVCSGQCPKHAKNKYLQLLDERGWTLVGEYKGVRTKVKVICNQGHEFEQRPSDARRGYGCTFCSGLHPELAKERYLSLLNEKGFTLCSSYNGTQSKVKLRCSYGHEFEQTPASTSSGKGCSVCYGNNLESAKKDYLDLLKSENWTLLSEYISGSVHADVRCDNGHTFQQTPSNFKRGKRCPVCSGMCKTHAEQEFRQLVESRGWTILSDYKTAKDKVQLKCENGHLFEQAPTTTTNKLGIGCPGCAEYGFNSEEPSRFYVQELSNEFGVYSYKFGITNNDSLTRMNKQSSLSKFTHRLLIDKGFDKGLDALNLERLVKKTLKSVYVAKEDMLDGYTETINPSDFDKLINIIDTYSIPPENSD
ncbi:hypothetical protein [Vibrio sp. TBV020]|uniref:hypothetical protein n=1 Tax=Vibrio sp. TBV020 TaxID=3137398 RepID=UPI0038CD922C